MRYFFQLVFFIAALTVQAQSKDIILEKVKAQYALGKPLQFTTSYNLYKSANSKILYSSYKGSYFKNSVNDVLLTVDQTEYLATKKISAQISNLERIILVTKGGQGSKEEYDIAKILSMFEKSTLKDRKTYWEIELTSRSISQLPYSRIVIHVGKDYFIQKQIFYYGSGINFSKDLKKNDIQYPRLEIVFGKPNRNPIPVSKFDTSKYFTITGKDIRLNGIYSKYKLIDQR